MHSIQQLFDLKGKTAVITGGSRGLGLQIAEALGEQGASLVITSRKQDELDEAVAHLKQMGIAATAIAADLGKAEAIPGFVASALAHLGHVDILVNNAGATWGSPAEDHPLEAWDKVMNLNVRSIFLLSQAIGKQSMIPRRSGRIISVASIAGLAVTALQACRQSLTTPPRRLSSTSRVLWQVSGVSMALQSMRLRPVSFLQK
jgi:gluconate 5-dehydrogenase